MKQLGWLYRSNRDRRYYVLCLRCFLCYGNTFKGDAERDRFSKLWPIYENIMGDLYYLKCIYGDHRIGTGEVELFDHDFQRNAPCFTELK